MNRAVHIGDLPFAAIPLLADPRPLAPVGTPSSVAAGENLGLAAAFLVSGAVVAVLILGHFVGDARYRRPAGPDKGLGFVAAGREARARISALAPKVMLVAEKEEALSRSLTDGPLRDETRRQAEALLAEAVPHGLWEKFVTASSLAERDPERAHEELDELAPAVESALDKLERVEKSFGATPYSDGGRENPTEEG